MTYEWLLMQLRLLADANKDKRSLVAIAAKFERDVDDLRCPRLFEGLHQKNFSYPAQPQQGCMK